VTTLQPSREAFSPKANAARWEDDVRWERERTLVSVDARYADAGQSRDARTCAEEADGPIREAAAAPLTDNALQASAATSTR
jgi:hypothetical protein